MKVKALGKNETLNLKNKSSKSDVNSIKIGRISTKFNNAFILPTLTKSTLT